MSVQSLPEGIAGAQADGVLAKLGLTPTRAALITAAVLVYLVGIPILLGGQPYWLGVLTNASMLSFISLGVWVMFAIGRVDIAQGAFAMIGGYTTAILSTRYG